MKKRKSIVKKKFLSIFSDLKKCYICRRIIKSNFKIVIYEKGNKIQFGLP